MSGLDESTIHAEFSVAGHDLTDFKSKSGYWVAACKSCRHRISVPQIGTGKRIVDPALLRSCTKRRAEHAQTAKAGL